MSTAAEPSNSANGAMLSPEASQIEVITGAFVDVANPDSTTLELEDIARGMAFTCRHGGHVKVFYSVAEHAVLVHDLLEAQLSSRAVLVGALFHDAAEAYLGDIIAPLKWALRHEELLRLPVTVDADLVAKYRGAYDRLSDRMDDAIVQRFGLDKATLESRELRIADMWALRIEAERLTTSGGEHWRWPGHLPNDGQLPSTVRWVGGMGPSNARELWLDRVERYSEEIS